MYTFMCSYVRSHFASKWLALCSTVHSISIHFIMSCLDPSLYAFHQASTAGNTLGLRKFEGALTFVCLVCRRVALWVCIILGVTTASTRGAITCPTMSCFGWVS